MRRLWMILVIFSTILALPQAQSPDDLVHSVGAGETLIAIANAYGVTLERLLALNNLDPEAYLQIGQHLVILPAGERGAAEASPEPEAEPTHEPPPPRVASGNPERADLPPAPLRAADAPMMDPADISPQVCFAIFEDDNQNTMREPEERFLSGGQISFFDSADGEQLRHVTDGESAPECVRNFERERFRIEASPPAGYGLTSPATLHLDLRAGGKVQIEFGAKRDLATFEPLPPDSVELAAQPDTTNDSLLVELSGLFALLMAGVVLLAGFVVSILVRGR